MKHLCQKPLVVLLNLILLVSSISCGTAVNVNGAKFKTYADATNMALTMPGGVSVTMNGMNHSKVNQVWAKVVYGVSKQVVDAFKVYLYAKGMVEIGEQWYDNEALKTNTALSQSKLNHEFKMFQEAQKLEHAKLAIPPAA